MFLLAKRQDALLRLMQGRALGSELRWIAGELVGIVEACLTGGDGSFGGFTLTLELDSTSIGRAGALRKLDVQLVEVCEQFPSRCKGKLVSLERVCGEQFGAAALQSGDRGLDGVALLVGVRREFLTLCWAGASEVEPVVMLAAAERCVAPLAV